MTNLLNAGNNSANAQNSCRNGTVAAQSNIAYTWSDKIGSLKKLNNSIASSMQRYQTDALNHDDQVRNDQRVAREVVEKKKIK
jgi:hypothetical protein